MASKLLNAQFGSNARMGVYLALKELNDSIKWTDKELANIAKIKAQGKTSEERKAKQWKARHAQRMKMLERKGQE